MSDWQTNGESGEAFDAVYDRLRGLAASFLGPDADKNTLQPTAVVHEAFMRLGPDERDLYESREHFVCVAAKAMRCVIIDHARKKNAAKRGGEWDRVTLTGVGDSRADRSYGAAELGDALEKLERLSPRQVRIVDMRFFGEMTEEQIATALGVSDRTVRNEWRVARAWLRSELGEGSPV